MEVCEQIRKDRAGGPRSGSWLTGIMCTGRRCAKRWSRRCRRCGRPILSGLNRGSVELMVDVIRAARAEPQTAFDTGQPATALLFGNKASQQVISAVLQRGVGK